MNDGTQDAETATAFFCAIFANRAKVREALEQYLHHEPTTESKSRIKRLRGLLRPQYRLRVEDIRVYYDVDNEEMTVEVLAIVPKSASEAWLAQEGETDETGSSL